jgi:hypothetical protein
VGIVVRTALFSLPAAAASMSEKCVAGRRDWLKKRGNEIKQVLLVMVMLVLL